MNFKIQPLDNTQAKEVSDLVKENLKKFRQYGFSARGISNLSDYYSEQNISLKNREPNLFYVIIRNQEICGVGRVNVNRIESTYIKIGHQKQGLGTTLLFTLERIIKENGHDQVELLSVGQSTGFYEKLGYRKVDKIRDSMGNAIRMIKKVGEKENV